MNKNIVSTILFYIGIAEIIVGIILGLLFATPEHDYPQSFLPFIFLAWTLAGFVIGMLFIGFSEVIKILDNISRKLDDSEKNIENENIENEHKEMKIEKAGRKWSLTDADMEKIVELYKDKNVISKVIPTPYEDFSIITFEGTEKIDIVNTGGYKANILIEEEGGNLVNKIYEWYRS